MSEQIHATAFGAAGLGLPGAMWALDQLKVEVPTPVVVLILIVSAGAFLFRWGCGGTFYLSGSVPKQRCLYWRDASPCTLQRRAHMRRRKRLGFFI